MPAGSPDPNHANAGEAHNPGSEARAAAPDARVAVQEAKEAVAEEIPEMPKAPALDPLPGADGNRDPITGEQKAAEG